LGVGGWGWGLGVGDLGAGVPLQRATAAGALPWKAAMWSVVP
jgi:hypothetical protein